MNRLMKLLRDLVAAERLPRDEVAAPAAPRPRRGFLHTLVARETLPRDEATGPTRPPGLLRWLWRSERLPHDPPTTPPGGDGDRGDRREGAP
jgi:hypothetical protein